MFTAEDRAQLARLMPLHYRSTDYRMEDIMRFAYRSIVSSFGLALLGLTLTGCAVLFNPNPQSVPVVLELDGRKNYEVVVRWQGQERRIALESTISGTYVALDVLPGLAFAGVSYALGSAWSEGAVDSFSELVVIIGSGTGMAVGVGSAALNVIVDGSTGRWRQLSPTTIAVVFD